jgi:hypothetical protein
VVSATAMLSPINSICRSSSLAGDDVPEANAIAYGPKVNPVAPAPRFRMNLRLFDFMTYKLNFNSIVLNRISPFLSWITQFSFSGFCSINRLIRVLLSLLSLPNASAHQTISQSVQR